MSGFPYSKGLSIALPLRKMVERAWAWAQARNKVRKNGIHGEEEIQIVLSETFSIENQEVEEHEQSGSIAVQESLGFQPVPFDLRHDCSFKDVFNTRNGNPVH